MNKKRPADNSEPTPARANKRRAATTPPLPPAATRVTRSAYKKLNASKEVTTPLHPGLPTHTRRRKRIPVPAPPTQPQSPIATTSAAAASEGPGAEEQWKPALPSIVGDSAYAAAVLTEAANPGGPAPVAYMGDGLEKDPPTLPDDRKVVCATDGPRAPVNDGQGSPQQLRTSSDASPANDTATSIRPSLSHEPNTSQEMRNLSGISGRRSIVCPLSDDPPADRSTFRSSSIFDSPRRSGFDSEIPTDMTGTKEGHLVSPCGLSGCCSLVSPKTKEFNKSSGKEEEEPVPAVVQASYSLSHENAIELLVNERILQGHKAHSEPPVVENTCSPVFGPSSVDWTATEETLEDAAPTIPEDGIVEKIPSFSVAGPLEQTIVEDVGREKMSPSSVGDAKGKSMIEDSRPELTSILPGAGSLVCVEIEPVEAKVLAQSKDESLTPIVQKTSETLGTEMIDSTVETNKSPPQHLAGSTALEKRDSGQQGRISIEGSACCTSAIFRGHPSTFPPWPYGTQIAALPTDDDQYSVETYAEDSVIY